MSFDAHKNFCKVLVSQGYNASATSVVLSSGGGAKLPAVPFNLTWYDSTLFDDPADDPNVERVRVTAITGDTLTITRAVDSTSAKTHNTASSQYVMLLAVGASELNAIETAIGASQSSIPPFRDKTGPAIPYGTLIKGTNVLGVNVSYNDMFDQWDTQFPTYIKPQLDIIKNRWGLNTVRLTSGLGGVAQGRYTQSRFHQCMEQFIDYCSSIGLFVYITVGDVFNMDGITTGTASQRIALMKPYAMAYLAFIDKFPNIMGVDLWNEFFYDNLSWTNTLSFSDRLTIATDWSQSARGQTSLPITWTLPTNQSNSSSAVFNSTSITQVQQLIAAGCLDFVDLHVYYLAQASDAQAYVSAIAPKKLIIGECGKNTTSGDSTRAPYYAMPGPIVSALGLAGALAWTSIDGVTAVGFESTNMGLMKVDFTDWPLSVAAVKAWPSAPVAPSTTSDEVISSPLTLYASKSGNDSNDGLTSGTPKTVNGALSYLSFKTLLANVVIQIADSTTYDTTWVCPTFYGPGTCFLRGNTSDRHAVKIEMNGTNGCVAVTGGRYQFEYVGMHTGQQFGAAFNVSGGLALIGNGVTFYAETQGSIRHIYINSGAKFAYASGITYYIEGGADSHIMFEDYASMGTFVPLTINCNGGAQAFVTAFLELTNFALVKYVSSDGHINVTNGSITGKRWNAENLSILKSFGGQDPNNFWPGNSNGSADASSKSIIS